MTFQYYVLHVIHYPTELAYTQTSPTSFGACGLGNKGRLISQTFLWPEEKKDVISRRHHWFPVAKCCLLLSYRFSVLWNSVILRFCAPIHSSWFSDPSKLGSSKGLESPRKKCNKGIANSHSPSALRGFAMISLQRSWIPSTALLKVHERQNKPHLNRWGRKARIKGASRMVTGSILF